MTLTRRLFASLMPAAPAVASTGLKTLASNMDNTPAPAPMQRGIGSVISKEIFRAAAPPTQSKYHEAMEVVQRANTYRYRLRDMDHDPDINIAALRSVSAQHKRHMQLSQRAMRDAAERSFSEQLAESFGLTEYFKNRNIGDEPQAAASGGY